jgi:uroporphyrinogen decarboxylase
MLLMLLVQQGWQKNYLKENGDSMKMTSKERMMKAIKLEVPDRVPVFITALSHSSRVYGATISQMRENPEIAARAAVLTSETYGTDCVYIYQDYGLLLGDIKGIKVKIPEDSPPSIKDHPLRGVNRENYKIPRFPDISDPKNRNIQQLLNITERTCRLAGDDTLSCFCAAGPFTLAALLRGVENFCIDLYENADCVKALIEASAHFSLETLIAGIESGATMASIADPTASPNLISPAKFLDFVKPYLEAIVKGLHSHFPDKSIPVRLHICGDTTPIHDHMVKTHADILSLDQAVDLKKAKECCGGKVCLMGNVDPSRLYLGSSKEIEELSRQCIEDAKEKGGFILASGCEIPPDCSQENVKMLCTAAKKYGTY